MVHRLHAVRDRRVVRLEEIHLIHIAINSYFVSNRKIKLAFFVILKTVGKEKKNAQIPPIVMFHFLVSVLKKKNMGKVGLLENAITRKKPFLFIPGVKLVLSI